jgi:hypothetical protein
MSFVSSIRATGVVAVILSTVGCATHFKETHFFQSVDRTTNQPTNYYRLKVSGYGAMSSTRFVSGYYDERAVDLFFNEVKVAPTADNANGSQPLFVDAQKSPGTTDVIKPLDPVTQHGAFVMILSTNASSVSRTIGQFAENQVVADAITNLANRDVLLRDAAAVRAQTARANATADELVKLMAQIPTGETPGKAQTERALLRVLNTIGTGLSGVPTAFDSLDQAELWFAQQAQQGGAP